MALGVEGQGAWFQAFQGAHGFHGCGVDCDDVVGRVCRFLGHHHVERDEGIDALDLEAATQERTRTILISKPETD